jgi:hypothetical protein
MLTLRLAHFIYLFIGREIRMDKGRRTMRAGKKGEDKRWEETEKVKNSGKFQLPSFSEIKSEFSLKSNFKKRKYYMSRHQTTSILFLELDGHVVLKTILCFSEAKCL